MSRPNTPSPDTNTTPPRRCTTSDSKLVATREFYTAAYRLNNSISILNDAVEVLSDPDSTPSKIATHVDYIAKLVVPTLGLVHDTIEKHAVHVSPMAGVKSICAKLEKKAVASIIKPSKRKSESVQILQHFITPSSPRLFDKPPSSKRRRLTRSQAAKEDDDIEVPEPANGIQYTKIEMLEYLESIPEETGTRGKRKKVIQKMMDLKYTPYTASSGIYKALRLRKSGRIIKSTEWNSGGRPAILTRETLLDIADEINSLPGKALGKRDINDIIVRHMRKMIVDQGHVVLNVPDVLIPTTLNNYIAELALVTDLAIVKSSIPKTNSRYAAENSIRASIQNTALIGLSNFIEVNEDNVEFMKALEDMSDDTRLLYDLVKQPRPGVSLVPVLPRLLFSTDDTTQFIFEGHETQPDQFKLVSRKSLGEKGTHSVFHVDEQKNMNGMRVKLTWTFSASGQCAPLFITVTGLSDTELPGDENIIVVKIPGLCIGGGGVGGNREEGYLCLQRNTPGADQERFDYYQKNVLLPFITAMRKECSDSFDPEMPVPAELRAVSNMDGDVPQIKATAANAELFARHDIVVNKHNSARSAVDQPADGSKVFKELPKVAAVTTVSDIDPDVHSMKKLIHDAFYGGPLSHLNLNTKTKKSLIDFISTLPEVATKVATRKNIVHGFIASGHIDEDHQKYPAFKKIMAGCRRTIPEDVYDSVITNYSRFFTEMFENGHISDSLYDELGYDVDRDAGGREVVRDAGISQEWKQRAKCLTHKQQVALRKQREENALAESQRKEELARVKKSLKAQTVNDAIEKLLLAMENDRVYNEDGTLENCGLEYFSKLLKRDELGYFILAHDPKVNSPADMPKNKGELKVAKLLLETRDVDAPLELSDPRILWAYKCRCQPLKPEWEIPRDSMEEDCCVADDDSASTSPEVEEIMAEETRVAEIVLGNDSVAVLPSELLGSVMWVTTVCRLFGIDVPPEDPTVNITQQVKDRADYLVKMLRLRMNSFMNKRKVSRERSKHWAIQLAIKNMSVVAAYMVLADHVKRDLSCLDETKSLLTPDYSKFKLCHEHNNHQGAYLYYDANNGIFIRSGKVCGNRGFGKRHEEHEKGASADTNPKSDFYIWYPTADCSRAQYNSKRGLFDSLTQYVAAGFDPESESASLINRSHHDGGVLILEGKDSDKIKGAMKQTSDEMLKFTSFLSYQFELGYDLAIAPSDNVSGSFGFESFVGLFGV